MDNNTSSSRAKKRKVHKEQWKRIVDKRNRHKSKGFPSLPTCTHTKKGVFYCSKLNHQDVRRFHQTFYDTSNKVQQDHFILKHTAQQAPLRNRVRKHYNRKPNNAARKSFISIKYFVKTRLEGMVQVCSKAFLGILGISKYRVQNVGKKYLLDHQSPKERRGGDKISEKFKFKKVEVTNFLKSLQFVESHYTREKSYRQYMPSDCTAKDLWKEYNRSATVDLQVKYSYFLHIFNYDFNISFKSPATDACSQCIRLKSQLEEMHSGPRKVEVMAEYTVHKMKSKAFYSMLQKEEDPSVLKLSFDCQKNLVLPRVPDQSTYYSRQLYLFNFTICEGNSTSAQNPGSVYAYTWCENERFKGSNEIASILYYHLKSKDLSDIQEVQLFCDGCPGQNKNITVLGMLCKFLSETRSCKKITLTYPVVGHSFIPPDRVFGRIEKKIKKKDTIIKPSEYWDVFSQFCSVRKVGSDVPIYDWKTAVAPVIKAPGQLHFKFKASKRMIIEKQGKRNVTVQGEINYRINSCNPKSILKRGKKIDDIIPELLPINVGVRAEKKKDVENLLTSHFGTNWRSNGDLQFYVPIVDNTDNGDGTDENNVEEYIIEDDDPGISI